MARCKWIRNAARVGLVVIAALLLLILGSVFFSLDDPSSWVPLVVIGGGVLFGPGLVLALLLLLPPLKRLTRRSDQTKAATPIVMAGVSFVVTFAILMFVYVQVAFFIYSLDRGQVGTRPDQVAYDLWRREMLPPFIRQSQPACYEDDPVICQYVVTYTQSSGPLGADSWGSYLVVAVASLPSMSLCVGLSDYFVGRKQDQKEQEEIDLPAPKVQ